MTPRRQMLIAAMAGVLVTVLFFVFALRPKMSQIEGVREEIEASRQQELSLRAELDRLKEAGKNQTDIVRQLNVLDGFLPDDADLPGFIVAVNEAATAAGLELLSIAPSPPTTLQGAEGVQVVGVNVSALGGFHRLEDFLIRLETLRRLVEVKSLTITPQTVPGSDQVTLNTSIAIEMYVTQAGARVTGAPGTAATPTPTPTPETT